MSFHGEWHEPGLAESRIRQLCKPFLDQIDDKAPLMIQLQSGMWDLALFGRREALVDKAAVETPLSDAQLKWWRRRMLSVIRTTKETWPGVPIVYRTLHRPAVKTMSGKSICTLDQPSVLALM